MGCLSPSPTDCALAPRRNGGIPRPLWSSHGADPRVLLRHYGADRTATTTCSSPAACLTTYESPDTPKPRASPPLESPPVARHGRVAAGPDAPRPCCRRRDVAKWVRAREKVPCAGYLLWGVSRLTADTRGCLKLKGSASVLSRCRELGAPAPLPLTVSKQGWWAKVRFGAVNHIALTVPVIKSRSLAAEGSAFSGSAKEHRETTWTRRKENFRTLALIRQKYWYQPKDCAKGVRG